ncbi:Hypothetical protein SRAE_2000506700 [Strongyloides ratti]|uniref:Uncharacterized protein n=1 Tax=Strongyloides ratti TaxID=34506 RepID=A0A090LL43_STRRB|nr:Hypothetical protein SRAE_2000506700 [Strongyloides ratti]CEF70435.1 Hypothetical protein SRAE_2000506700 [Strongyloides ratti]
MNNEINIPYFGEIILKKNNKSKKNKSETLNINIYSTKKPYLKKKLTKNFPETKLDPFTYNNVNVLSTTLVYDNNVYNTSSDKQKPVKSYNIAAIIFVNAVIIVSIIFIIVIFYVCKKNKVTKEKIYKKIKKSECLNGNIGKKIENIKIDVENYHNQKYLLNKITNKNKFKNTLEEIPQNNYSKLVETNMSQKPNSQSISFKSNDTFNILESTTSKKNIEKNLYRVKCNKSCVQQSKPVIYANVGNITWRKNEKDLSLFSFQISSSSEQLE